MGVGTMAISPTSASRCWKKEDWVVGWRGLPWHREEGGSQSLSRGANRWKMVRWGYGCADS